MRKIAVSLLVLITICSLSLGQAFADEENARQKASEYHKIALSDIIYTDQELKAFYYQNIQIIELLEQIRELLIQQVERQEPSSNRYLIP